jgi:hypothetical protein
MKLLCLSDRAGGGAGNRPFFTVAHPLERF